MILKIVSIPVPVDGIVDNILSNDIQFAVIADNMLIIIFLPEFGAARWIIGFDPIQVNLEHQRFKRSNHITQCRCRIDLCRFRYFVGMGLAPIHFAFIKGHLSGIVDHPDNKMDMIWHDHKFIQPDCWKPGWQCLPNSVDYSTDDWIVQYTFAVLRTHRDKICTRVVIIISLQSD